VTACDVNPLLDTNSLEEEQEESYLSRELIWSNRRPKHEVVNDKEPF
jgi:hypothetical protein